jgi:spore maturation protein SpmB
VAGTLQGSTETTFYVLAVYFGAAGIQRTRHAAAVGLLADVMGAVGTLIAVNLLLG